MHACVDDMYTDKCSAEARQNVADAKVGAFTVIFQRSMIEYFVLYSCKIVEVLVPSSIIYKSEIRRKTQA